MAEDNASDFLSSVKAKSKEAMSWFKDLVKKTARIGRRAGKSKQQLMDDAFEVTRTPEIGKMYLFQYDAKWKDILPYWDVWPLIFPFADTPTGWYGINLHYLPPKTRLRLMQALIKAQGISGKMDSNYKLKLSYNIIKGFTQAKPCVKQYLRNNIQTPLYGIAGDDWAYAVGLPLQQFKGRQPW